MSGPDPQNEDFDALARARALWSSGALDAALAAFAVAVAARPTNVKALVEQARALGARFQIAEAGRLLDRALALAGDAPPLRTVVAASLSHLFRDERAAELLRAMHPRSPAARAELAAACERMNRLDEALAEIDACLAAAPDVRELLLAKGRVLRRQGDAAAA